MGPNSIPERARLDGKVAVVTGGGRGIGRATAIRLAGAGAKVVVTARTETEISEVAGAIRRDGGAALAISADVSDWATVTSLVEETEAAFGPADVVVANAGVIEPVGPTWEVDAEAWADSLRINLTGAFFTARAFLPSMVERDGGALIFTSSGAASHPVVNWSAYCAAKAGLAHFVRNLLAEFDAFGVSVRAHAVIPGVVDTSMQRKIREKSEEAFPGVERYRAYHQQGVLRPPEEPAALIWWLATPMAADLSGHAASIDDPDVRWRLAEDLGIPEPGRRE